MIRWNKTIVNPYITDQPISTTCRIILLPGMKVVRLSVMLPFDWSIWCHLVTWVVRLSPHILPPHLITSTTPNPSQTNKNIAIHQFILHTLPGTRMKNVLLYFGSPDKSTDVTLAVCDKVVKIISICLYWSLLLNFELNETYFISESISFATAMQWRYLFFFLMCIFRVICKRSAISNLLCREGEVASYHCHKMFKKGM